MERAACLAPLFAAPSVEKRREWLQRAEAMEGVPADALGLLAAALARDPAERPSAADVVSVVERAMDRDVVRALKSSGGDGATVVLRAPNGDVRVYSDDGVFISEAKSTDGQPLARPPATMDHSFKDLSG